MNERNTKNVIFVCTGNTCRSPMAEAVFRYEAKRRGIVGVTVASAGTQASTSGRMHPFSLRTLEMNGLTIENFSPSPLTDEAILQSFAIICMTDEQRDVVAYMRWKLLKTSERAENNVYAFSDFTGYQIPDPYGQGEDAYVVTYEAITNGMDAIFAQLFPVEEPTVEIEEPSITETVEVSQKPRKPRKPRAKKSEGGGKTAVQKSSGRAKKSTGKKTTGKAGKRRPKKENE